MISYLKDSVLCDIGRCLNLCWLVFKKDNNEYSLHVQCAWRVIVDGIIVTTDYDMYEDENQVSEFDNKINSIKKNLLPTKVKNVIISEYYDVIIIMENGLVFSTFINSFDECWRVFKKGCVDEEHIVAYINKLVKE